MKIYTKTGDSGTTGLFGGGRISKSHPRIEAYGTVDELNASLGLALALWPEGSGLEDLRAYLTDLQKQLFVVGADLATPLDSSAEVPRISAADVASLEEQIDRIQDTLKPLRAFVLPAGSSAAAALHVARTVCRRAERRVVELADAEPVTREVTVFLNRLADLLFVLARRVNHVDGRGDTLWSGRK